MDRKQIEQALEGLEEEYILEALSAPGEAPGPGKEIPDMRETNRIRRTGRALAVLIAAAMALSVTALALGISVHRQRQEELRQSMDIDANHVESYVEYDVPEEETAELHVTALSAINNGEFVNVYLTLSPVTEEDMREMEERDMHFFFSSNGGESWGSATPVVWEKGASGSYWELFYKAWDEEAQTLTLECMVSLEHTGGQAPGELTLGRVAADEEGTPLSGSIERLGTAALGELGVETRKVMFDTPVEFVNEENGGRGRLLGLELTPTSCTWLLEHDDAEELYYIHDGRSWEQLTEAEQSRVRELDGPWARCIDRVTRGTLHLAGGGDFVPSSAESGGYEDGVVRRFAVWSMRTLDIEAVESITLDFNGETVPLR